MSIVLNEYDWAEKMIQTHDLGKKPMETLSRVSKYYYENQYSKREIRGMMDSFMLQCDPTVSLPRWSDMLDKITKDVAKYPLIKLDGVSVSKNEMKKIRELSGVQLQRFAFTILCVAKYWDAASAHNNHWVNTPDKEIMQMANVSTSIKRQSLMFSTLRDEGMIKFSRKVDNLNVQVLFMEGGAEAMHIQDFRNLGYQYMRYYDKTGYFECANCGLTVKSQYVGEKGRPQKYCKACAVKIKTRQSVDSVMRDRYLPKS
jgi:hypothetical protein